MNEKVLKTLEYDKIIEMLAEKANSAPGKKLCRELVPSTDLEEIRKNQRHTADALRRLFRFGSTSFGNNKDISFSVRSLQIGSTLSIPELLNIAAMLDNVSRVKSYGRQDRHGDKAEDYGRAGNDSTTRGDARDKDSPNPRGGGPAEGGTPTDTLDEYFELLTPLTGLSTEIHRCILSEEEIADDASPKLKSIRRSMLQTNDKIHSQLMSMVSGSYRSYLQDAVITMRNNRYCIPIKAEYKGQVNGMIHDQSATGSTYFIEPAAVVELNNKLRELELEEKEEIGKILADLSAQAGTHTEELLNDQKVMTLLDFIFAKAELAMALNATEPIFNPDRYINIRKGRHPLLDRKKVVPIDIHLGRDFDLLVITGPNTGGKTVSLKTMGLLTLMGQAGLHIPAADRSELSIFTEVYADIGDEQSIEQSLSTFSSHMTRIVHILEHADADSLCLFDELGAGTDPTEGAALAIAILSHLHDRGIRTMATTHYSELKIYALSTSFVENACCEFNVETLRPTYRLLIGIPGKSNAFAISSKLGLPDEIINAAREQIGQEDKTFEDVISDLEQSRITIEKEQTEIAQYKERIRILQEQLQQKNDKIDQAKDRILREANEKARSILQEAKEIADETIRDFHKAGAGTDIRELEKKRQKVRDKIGEKNAHLSVSGSLKAPEKKTIDPRKLKKGDLVRIVSMGLQGTVSTLPDAKGGLFVQCGIIRTRTNVSDLVYAEEKSVTAPSPLKGAAGSGKIKMSKTMSISTEINLLGKTVDEALSELDKYLDDAYLAHLPSVRVVHGKGTGALRSAVHGHLKRLKYVQEYRLGEYGEGDSGVTIVTFK
ncbi:MAG: endonuclease MutS2 [Lachnospiraceae bacterium]|uniref:endonuclease MutS2 n=1 Tax=uncultured Acetatifactor sp. TaxID=1671927 RepID=UPI0026192317|nr:endonuclease MutS2 [uncultured Acetatifactor sp.]MCI8790092.1 endonuclease MutS2 [Lachnospiraceae bacterium]